MLCVWAGGTPKWQRQSPGLLHPESALSPQETHVRRYSGAVSDRVPLYCQVIHLAIIVSEHEVLPGGDVLAQL